MTISIDPVLFRIGHLEVRWYGVMLAIGILAAIAIGLREARRRGVHTDRVYDAALWAVLGGLVGARLFHILDFWDYYAQNPGQILSLRLDGLAIYGGLVGGFVAVAAYSLVTKVPFWKLADMAAPGLPLGQVIGRIGCLINGCNFGAPTSLPWGTVWTNPASMAPVNDVPRHPAQIYEMLWSLAVLAVIWPLRKIVKADGVLFLIYIALYSAGRFVLSFTREDTIAFLGMRQAQVIGLASIALAIPVAIYLSYRSTRLVAAGHKTS